MMNMFYQLFEALSVCSMCSCQIHAEEENLVDRVKRRSDAVSIGKFPETLRGVTEKQDRGGQSSPDEFTQGGGSY